MSPVCKPLALAVVHPIAAQPLAQVAAEQPLGQIGGAQRGL